VLQWNMMSPTGHRTDLRQAQVLREIGCRQGAVMLLPLAGVEHPYAAPGHRCRARIHLSLLSMPCNLRRPLKFNQSDTQILALPLQRLQQKSDGEPRSIIPYG